MPTKSNNTGGRGGARPGAGRKKSAVKDKAENGNPGGRKLEVLDIPEVEGVAMPKPHDFLSAEQRDGSVLQAEVPEKYYLSQKACLGILRRASARGKELPEVLRLALERQASMDTTAV